MLPSKYPTIREHLALNAVILGGICLVLLLAIVAHKANAETYVINGTKDATKLQAIVAAAKDPKAKIERCKFTEKTDSNEGAVVCRSVELSPRGTLRLQK